MEKKDILLVNKEVFEFVLNLSDSDLEELVKKEAKLVLVKNEVKKTEDKKKKVDKKKATKVDKVVKVDKSTEVKKSEKDKKQVKTKVSGYIDNLKSISSKEKAVEYLKKSTVVNLKLIAKELNIYVKSKSIKSEIIDRIVEGTIGAKNKMNILKS